MNGILKLNYHYSASGNIKLLSSFPSIHHKKRKCSAEVALTYLHLNANVEYGLELLIYNQQCRNYEQVKKKCEG